MIFESHAHYDDEAFNEDRENLIHSMKENQIDYIMNIGASMKSSRNTVELTKKYPHIYGSVGVHPSETGELTDELFLELRELSRNEKIKAIGEIGLDYYWDEPDRKTQKDWFIRQIELAMEEKKPVIIHSRDAAQDTMDLLDLYGKGIQGGVIHCFSYGKEVAKHFLDQNYYLGIGGVITFKNGKKLREVVEYAPMENIVLETDSPYLSPEPYRGKRNSSLNLPFIAETIGKIKGITTEEVYRITENNAKKLYQMESE